VPFVGSVTAARVAAPGSAERRCKARAMRSVWRTGALYRFMFCSDWQQVFHFVTACSHVR